MENLDTKVNEAVLEPVLESSLVLKNVLPVAIPCVLAVAGITFLSVRLFKKHKAKKVVVTEESEVKHPEN